MNSESNRWLVLDRDNQGKIKIVLTKTIDTVIYGLEPIFQDKRVRAVVTSGYRSREKQLELILQKALQNSVAIPGVPDLATADLNAEIVFEGEQTKLWHLVWSKLLSLEVMINPPEPARAKFAYKRGGVDKPAGNLVGISPHQLGNAFDAARADLDRIAEVLEEAKKVGVPGLHGWLVERNKSNRAVHVDCREVV